MKKLIVITLIALTSSGLLFSQDLESVTTMYNNAVMELQSGEKIKALEAYQKVLEAAEALGGEGMEIADKCKQNIPLLYLTIGKDYINNKQPDIAVEYLQNAKKYASEYGDVDTEMSAEDLIPQVYLQEGNGFFTQKKYAEAIEQYRKVVAIDANNALAYLRLGQAASRINDLEAAVPALEKASELGQKNNAVKELGTLYLKKASDERKAQKHQAAITAAKKSLEYVENAAAYNICGLSYMDMGKNKESIEYFETYLTKSPNARDVNQTKYRLAVAYEAISNKDKACGYYKEIVNDPSFKAYAEHKIKNELKCN